MTDDGHEHAIEPIRRILCATDTSEASQQAVNKAVALALHLDAELVLMYVSTTAEDDRDIPAMLATLREVKRLADEMLRHDKAALDGMVEAARAAGATVQRHLVNGEPADEIVRAADEFDVDFLMTGTHGRTGLDKFMLGSVAERVIRTSRRPVLVARNPDYLPSEGYRRILVPTDFSDNAKRAFELAARVGAKDCEIELLHCWRLPPGVGAGPTAVVESLIKSFDKEIHARGQAVIEELTAGGATVTFHAVRQPPAQGVTERISEGGFDLVVMGSHGRSGLSRFMLGSVAETTIHHAPCSVMTVPELDD